MSPDDAQGAGSHRLRAPLRRRAQVRPLELFFDLVFALGFTQCAALVSAGPAWQGVVRGLLVLAVLWWAWGGYASTVTDSSSHSFCLRSLRWLQECRRWQRWAGSPCCSGR